jgi:hypothetical protein
MTTLEWRRLARLDTHGHFLSIRELFRWAPMLTYLSHGLGLADVLMVEATEYRFDAQA